MTLTIREFEVAKFFSLGYTAKEIATLLFLSVRTIDTHKTNVFNKNESVSNIADLVREFVLKFGNPKNAVLTLIIILTIKSIYNI